MSERKNAYHSRQMVAKEDWRFPTSCPAHRDLSKLKTIAARSELCEKTGKRSFVSKSEADTFAAAQASNYNAPTQRSYECLDCGGFHLSSMTPEQNTHAQAPSLVKSTDQPIDKEKQICQLYREGKSTSEIGEQFQMHYLTVCKILRQHGLWTVKTGHPHHAVAKMPPAPVTLIKASDTVESLDAAEASLQAQLLAIQKKKQMLEEAQRLRVEMVGEKAFKISKEGEHATLPITELEPLIDQLMDLNLQLTKVVATETVAVGA